MRHQFVRPLGRGVELQRMVGDRMLAERQGGVGAVDARARRVGQVGDPRVAAGLEEVEEPDEVALDVAVGVLDAVADARLGGKVDHPVEAMRREAGLDGGTIGEVGADEGIGVASPLGELGEAGLLEPGVVVVVDVVEADHLVTPRKQCPRDVKADEAGIARDQDFQGVAPAL